MEKLDKKYFDKIVDLDQRAQCRDKLSIWFGSRDNHTHPVKELVANSTDEIINNFDEGVVDVTLCEDMQTIIVEDTGRGLQLHGTSKDGEPNYIRLLKKLFAGTKYDEATTTGTNGVGLTVTNYTSQRFEVTSEYLGYRYEVKFKDGGYQVGELSKTKIPKENHGTKILFQLDDEVYTNITFSIDEIRDIVKRYAISSSEITMNFHYYINGEKKTETFHYDSLQEYFEERVDGQTTSDIFGLEMVDYDYNDEETSMELLMTTTPESFQETYLNLTFLEEHGEIYNGVILAIQHYCNEYCKNNNLYKRDFLPTDVRTAVSFVGVMFSNNVEFTNQTKLSTDKKLYHKVAYDHATMLLVAAESQKPEKFALFVDHLLNVQRHNHINQRKNRQLKKKLTQEVRQIGAGRIEKLIDCNTHGEGSELFITEGDSAKGSVVMSRDSEYQAVYPLRGKILNCLKSDYDRIFKNQEVLEIIRALGCGVESKTHKDLASFNKNRLRYGKVIIATDADPDGAQIMALVITMFYRLLPTLLRDGHIYYAQTPLYEVKMNDGSMEYFFSENEMQNELPKLKGVYNVARSKGLGELDPEVLAEFAMNEETRRLVQVKINNEKELLEFMEKWMGDDIEGRREYIENNLSDFLSVVD